MYQIQSPNIARTLYTCRHLLNSQWLWTLLLCHTQITVAPVPGSLPPDKVDKQIYFPFRSPGIQQDGPGWGKQPKVCSQESLEEEKCNTIRKKHPQNYQSPPFVVFTICLKRGQEMLTQNSLCRWWACLFKDLCSLFRYTFFSMLSAKAAWVCQHLHCS